MSARVKLVIDRVQVDMSEVVVQGGKYLLRSLFGRGEFPITHMEVKLGSIWDDGRTWPQIHDAVFKGNTYVETHTSITDNSSELFVEGGTIRFRILKPVSSEDRAWASFFPAEVQVADVKRAVQPPNRAAQVIAFLYGYTQLTDIFSTFFARRFLPSFDANGSTGAITLRFVPVGYRSCIIASATVTYDASTNQRESTFAEAILTNNDGTERRMHLWNAGDMEALLTLFVGIPFASGSSSAALSTERSQRSAYYQIDRIVDRLKLMSNAPGYT